MKDEILAQIGFIGDDILQEISETTVHTRQYWRKNGKIKYIRLGTQYLYPIDLLRQDLAEKVSEKYGNEPKREIL